MLAGLGRDAAAQQVLPSVRSTRTGVYNEEQALRGRDVYAGLCQSCHPAASHTGVAFKNTWTGRPLSELFGYIRDRMPKNEPGSLTPEEYADVLAYLLKLNQMPAGAVELPTDTVTLKRIRIDTAVAKLTKNH
jgi:mono/diheme cytochrome c family protein